MRVRVNDLVLRLYNASWPLFVRRFVFIIFVSLRCFVGIFFGLLLCFLLILVFFLGLHDVFLELGFTLVHVHVVDELVIGLHADGHELWFATMAFASNVLHDLVVSR